MPRPKRSRVAAARPTKAPSPSARESRQSSAAPPAVAKPATAQARYPSSDIYDVSDREKERIKQRVAEAAKSESRRTSASQRLALNSEQAKALAAARSRRDDAMNRLDDLTSTSRPDDTESRAIEHSPGESAANLQPRLSNASGLDLDDDPFNLDDSLADTEHGSEETQTGYRSTDTSSFNISLFRRRPRASSVAGRDDVPIRPSSRGQNTPSISSTLTFGNFKRRARERSILGTGRKPRRERSQSQTSQASRNASVLGDGDDSGPDGESTPLNSARRKTRASLAATGSRDGSPQLPSRKRKSLESHQDGREKRTALEVEDNENAEAGAGEIYQSIEVDIEPAKTPPRGRTRERERFSTPRQEDDPDMAPPLSISSEDASPVAWPSLETLAHRTYTRRPPPRPGKTPEPSDASSDLSSPPSLTHSPNYTAVAKAVSKKAPPPPKKLTTADLTSLLPQRRHKAARRSRNSDDAFDLDDSDDDRYDISAAGNDEDELSYVGSRAARRRNGRQPLGKSTTNRKNKAAEAGNVNGKKRVVRTYGMREDEENEDVEEEIVVGSGGEDAGEGVQDELPDEETSQMMRERIGEELQKAAKKFREVDKWELSFEVVTESSSPEPDAR
ncbi:c68fe0ce-f2f8-4e6f-8bff-719bc93340e2 [Thermothielavioides terrestris]|uniref:C68fe0ce-f2f8-4e6f-8bff-719bc93340e2 n=1 Tax=Thermothielavioides terrestris TaxID=2587410 RepID=A0A446BJN9_9PEZI|nr:c68fe0ce-f2f8-4e6f-8bff-719bc93340e2 [Thermothielavioides terrestris]